ncbi:hypothetical protein [Alteribacter populi]|uniref:hypothetical protein n=1 Tax=Alteribacter populi TaxID=2011011 RepID=UPI000BBAF75A|nr:hypothetical protein [Alteribacter populi]
MSENKITSIDSQKGIKIGIVGGEAIVQKIQQEIKAFPSFYPLFRVFEDIEEVPAIVEQLIGQVEVILFSGYIPYQKVKETIDYYKTPIQYIHLGGTAPYSSLYRLHKTNNIAKLSVDTLSEHVVERTLQELGELETDIYFYRGKYTDKEEDIVRFHIENYEKNGCVGVLTGLRTVSDILTERNIPNEWVVPTHQDIIVSLERALLSTETRRNKELQVIIGLIHIDKYNKLIDAATSEFELQKLKLDIHRIILDYAQTIDGHLTHLGGGEYLFVTTRGVFERETRGYKSIPLLQEVKETFNISISIGVGFANTANGAGVHARLALRQSQEYGGNICFIVREDRSVIGPVKMGDPMVYDLTITDQDFLQKAEKAGMTATYMSRLMAQVSRNRKVNYTAQELAAVLGVTVRSTHRILLQWLDAGLVDIVGEEKITSRGRPRQIYSISFISEQASIIESKS